MNLFRVITGDDPSSYEEFDTFEAAEVYLEEHEIPRLRDAYRGESEWEAAEEVWAEIVEVRTRWGLQHVDTLEPDPEADPPEKAEEAWDLMPVDIKDDAGAKKDFAIEDIGPSQADIDREYERHLKRQDEEVAGDEA